MSCRMETVLCLYLPYTEVDARGDYFTRMNSLDNFILCTSTYVCKQLHFVDMCLYLATVGCGGDVCCLLWLFSVNNSWRNVCVGPNFAYPVVASSEYATDNNYMTSYP